MISFVPHNVDIIMIPSEVKGKTAAIGGAAVDLNVQKRTGIII